MSGILTKVLMICRIEIRHYLKNSILVRNFFSLSLLQATSYLFPLITIPYLSRVLGVEYFGLVNFANSFTTYFTLIVNYGFTLSGTREIAQSNKDNIILGFIFNKIIFSKIILFIFSTIIFFISFIFTDKISNNKLLYILFYLNIFFNIFYPTWFFQGVQKLHITAFLTFIIKLIFTILIFIFIKTKDDYIFYPLATLIGQIFISFFSIYYIVNKYNFKIKFPGFFNILYTLKDGTQLFFTTIVIHLYTTTNLVLLGFFTGDREVGLFSAAYKIVVLIMSLFLSPLGQSLFPNIGIAFSTSLTAGILKIKKAIKIMLVLTIIPSLIIFTFSKIIILKIFGLEFKDAIITLRIMSFIPVIIGLSNIYGIQGLINLKKDKIINIITGTGAVLCIILNIIFIPKFTYNGPAISWLITETFITILMYIFYKKKCKYL